VKAPRAQKESKSMSSTRSLRKTSQRISAPKRKPGQVNVPSTSSGDAQTQRSLEHFSIGQDVTRGK